VGPPGGSKYYHHRNPHFESSKSTSQTIAPEVLRNRLHGQGTGSEERVTFDHLRESIIADYELKGYRSLGDLANLRLKHVSRFLGGQRGSISPRPGFVSARMARRKQGAANETINRELSAIRRMFRLAIQDRILSQAPDFPMLEAGQPRESYVTQSEFDALSRHLPEHAQLIIRCVWNTARFKAQFSDEPSQSEICDR
jgi:hypothetical protein